MLQYSYITLIFIGNLLPPFLNQVNDTPPTVSRNGRPIELLPSGPISLIGNNVPSLAALMHRGVRFKKITTRRAKTSPSVAATALAQAFKVYSQLI